MIPAVCTYSLPCLLCIFSYCWVYFFLRGISRGLVMSLFYVFIYSFVSFFLLSGSLALRGFPRMVVGMYCSGKHSVPGSFDCCTDGLAKRGSYGLSQWDCEWHSRKQTLAKSQTDICFQLSLLTAMGKIHWTAKVPALSFLLLSLQQWSNSTLFIHLFVKTFTECLHSARFSAKHKSTNYHGWPPSSLWLMEIHTYFSTFLASQSYFFLLLSRTIGEAFVFSWTHCAVSFLQAFACLLSDSCLDCLPNFYLTSCVNWDLAFP